MLFTIPANYLASHTITQKREEAQAKYKEVQMVPTLEFLLNFLEGVMPTWEHCEEHIKARHKALGHWSFGPGATPSRIQKTRRKRSTWP